jgi:6-phosphogluconolactonase
LFVYIGTYTDGASVGIYRYRLDMASGALARDSVVTDKANPSFLTMDPSGRCLFVVNELTNYGGQPSGAVTAYAVHPATGRLSLLTRQPSLGAAPCYISLDPTGRYALVANYVGGSVTVLPIGPDGTLGPATDTVRHEGAGPNPARQEAPHPHSIQPDPSGAWVLVPDLGLDRIFTYRLDPHRGKLVPADIPWHAVRPGAGPRHLTFHPTAPYAYVINELDSSLTAFHFNVASGSLSELQTAPTLPDNYPGPNTGADIHVHPSGRFLYGSNRGHDSIVVYQVDAGTGRLTLVEHESTRGRTPRGFALDPSGQFLLAANQESGTVVTFRIDQQSGALSFTGHVAAVPSPVCLQVVANSRHRG